MKSIKPTYDQKRSVSMPGKPATEFMIYGIFIVICQLMFMLLRLNILLSVHDPAYLYGIIIPEFEYPLINIALITAGAYIIDMHYMLSSQ